MNKLVIVPLSVAMGLLIIGCNDASNKHLDDATKDMNDANTDVKAAMVAEKILQKLMLLPIGRLLKMNLTVLL
jgi:hypothetical protein